MLVQKPNSYKYSEPIVALMEAWSVHHKSTPTLLTMHNDCPACFDPTWGYYALENGAIFGQELESFNQNVVLFSQE